MKTIQNIVVSNTLPTNKNVLWVDTSKNTKQLKIFYNNVWTNALNTLSPKELASILEQSKQYTDEQIKELIGSAPEALNTLKELADAIGENEDVIDTLNKSVNNKQDKLVSGTNIKTINGESILGEGDIVIGGGGSGGGTYPVINADREDMYYNLQPNTFYNLGKHNASQYFEIYLNEPENTDIVNEYIFEFTTDYTIPTLTILAPIRWANDSPIELLPNKRYLISIVNTIATYIVTTNISDNYGTVSIVGWMYGSIDFLYPVASDVEVTVLGDDGNEHSEIVYAGDSSADLLVGDAKSIVSIVGVTPDSDDMYNYIVNIA